MTASSHTAPDRPDDRSAASKLWRSTAGLRAAIIAGAVSGALVGGVAGRMVMRLTFLLDDATEGVRTDSGATVGEFTVGGSLGLVLVSAIAGAFGGLLYLGLRRWLSWRGAARGIAFGVLMVFGPGLIFVAETDLQIFEPALVVYAMFVTLILAYALATAFAVDRLRPEPPVRPSVRVDRIARVVRYVAGAAICIFAVLIVGKVVDEAGTCLSAAEGGGCGARPPGG